MFVLLFFLFTLVSSMKTIKLNETNVITVRGSINPVTSSNFVYELNKKKNKKNLYVFINTNGGSVESGSQIISEIMKYNLTCIADKAYSMGFVILQSCKKRYITMFGKLMQHQISYGINDEKQKIDNYGEYVTQMDDILSELQAKKINISVKKLKEKTSNNWWMYGSNAVKNNCADSVVQVTCSDSLTKKNETIEYNGNKYIYSKCPLIEEPIDVNTEKGFKYYFI
jgi:ATP-dependent protease ClpP protease subunit